MLLKEMNFRDIVDKYLYIDAAGVAQNLGSIFEVTEDATFEDLGIDSLDMAELICDIEEKLDIDFGEPEGLETIEDLVSYIDSL